MARTLAALYDAAAPTWGRRMRHLGFPAAYRAIMAEALLRFPPGAGPMTAIDLGAGDGAFAEALADRIGPRLSLSLLDCSAAMLQAADLRLGPGRARLIEGELDAADPPTGGYDVVVSAHLLEHLAGPEAGLARIGRFLRPGGLVILVVSRPHWCSWLVWLAWRHRRYREAEIRAALHGAGFVEIQCWAPPSGPPRRLSLAYAARTIGA